MTTKPKAKSNRPCSPSRNEIVAPSPMQFDPSGWTQEEREIYGRLICQYCGKSVSAELMEKRRAAQSFPVCEPCLQEIIPLAEKMQREMGAMMQNL